jgi:hypothetical protein
MKEKIASLIKPFAELCYQIVDSVSTKWALVIYILVLIVLAIWVISLKKEKPVERTNKLSIAVYDLRFWALGIIFLQVAIYLVFH